MTKRGVEVILTELGDSSSFVSEEMQLVFNACSI